MAQTHYLVASSIDGFIADADRFRQFFAAIGAMTMGAATYEWVLDHEHLLDQPDKWRDYYGDVPCWIFTHRPLPVIPPGSVSSAATSAVSMSR